MNGRDLSGMSVLDQILGGVGAGQAGCRNRRVKELGGVMEIVELTTEAEWRESFPVMRELVAMGIDDDRLESEGYGAQHPVGDNNTEEGRQQNRRIAVRVTEK